MNEHLWCRSDDKSSLFDVSHMGQIRWHGKDRIEFLERVVVGDIGGLSSGSGCLSLVTNEEGGILDDTVITNYEDYVYMVSSINCDCVFACFGSVSIYATFHVQHIHTLKMHNIYIYIIT